MKTKKYNKASRHEKILELLEENETLEVSWLADYFTISEMSIRNDLNFLEDQGKLRRQHGKATIISNNFIELPLREKELKNKNKKSAIGKRAAALIKDGDSVFLDAGTTTEYVARNMESHKDVTVFTNGINIVNTLLSITDLRTYIIGGEICNKSYASVGEIAEKSLLDYYTKISIVSADGFSLERGISNNSYQANIIAKRSLENSSIKILLVDSSKLGVVGPFHFGNFSDIDILVTDSDLPEDAANDLRKTGVELILAEL